MGRDDIYKDGKKTQWKKGESGNPKGRPKKLVSATIEALKEKGEVVSAAMVKEIYTLLTSITKDELKKIAKDKSQPMITTILANALISDNGFEIIEKMLDRANGKATQKQEINQNVKVDRFQFEMPEATPEMQKKWEEAQNKEE